jgi:arginine decarboxylase
MKFRFPIVIIDEDFRSENTSGLGIRALADAMEKEGMEVVGVTSYGDLSQFAQQQSRASAFVLSIDDEEFGAGSIEETDHALKSLRAFVEEIRYKNADIPIYLYGETRTSRHIPNDILRELHGFIHMFEDTPEFVARHIIREAKSYLDGLAPPFFRALVDYANDGSYSWHCPGHSGGVAFLKSPIGQMFHQFFGENMLRADVCNAVEELGQLLDHTGPVAKSERNAARIFNADHCYFVTNGTSTSNKMVWHSTVAPGDIVVVDRNCHKSILHSIIMCGAIPVFLMPTRNHLGIIGPIPLEEFSMESIPARSKPTRSRAKREQEAAHPDHHPVDLRRRGLQRGNPARNAGRPDRHPALRRSLAAARHLPRLLQEHARHRQGPSARQGVDDLLDPVHPQAAGRPVAGLAGAGARIGNRQAGPDAFNEAYLMHTSTSPQYSIIASLRRGRGHDGSAGRHRAGGRIDPGSAGLPPRHEEDRPEWGKDWWFKVWGPDEFAEEGIGRGRLDHQGRGRLARFRRPGPGFNMLDPIKATIVNPGLSLDGKFDETGIPASIVTKYLAEHGVIVEKCGLYSSSSCSPSASPRAAGTPC